MRTLIFTLQILISLDICADPVIYSSTIKGITDKNGGYTKIFGMAFQEIGWKPKWVFLPPKRSALLFKKSKEHCEIPGNLDFSPGQMIYSEPINYARLHAFTTRESGLKISSLKELKGLNLVVRVGWPLGDWKNRVNVNITKVETEKQQYKMLTTKSRRIDSAVAFIPDFFAALSKKELKGLYYNKDFVLNRLEDKIVCFKNPANQKLIEKLNIVLRKYRKNGTLKNILGPLYVSP